MRLLFLLSVLFPIHLIAVVSSSAYLSHDLIESTGNGTHVSIPFDTISFDDCHGFQQDGSYVAPNKGTLIITGIIEVSNLNALHKTLAVIVTNETTNEIRYLYAINPVPLQDGVPPSGYSQVPFALTMKCKKNDRFVMKVAVNGGIQTATIKGGAAETRLEFNFFAD